MNDTIRIRTFSFPNGEDFTQYQFCSNAANHPKGNKSTAVDKLKNQIELLNQSHKSCGAPFDELYSGAVSVMSVLLHPSRHVKSHVRVPRRGESDDRPVAAGFGKGVTPPDQLWKYKGAAWASVHEKMHDFGRRCRTCCGTSQSQSVHRQYFTKNLHID